MQQEELIFPGSIHKLQKIISSFSSENILLVRGKQSYAKSGAKEALTPIIEKFNVTEFYNFSVNPKLEEAQVGYNIFKEKKSNIIIAVGGGSVIDTAKIIKYLSIQENSDNASIPLIAIPTTAGTGSEATHFAVVYIDCVKHSYANPALLPTTALVDANLLNGQEKYQIAVSGIDAFAQGIESLWSIHSTTDSMLFAEKAIRLVWENLEKAIQGDITARIHLAEGSFYAGKAINITKTTGPHALSYGFTSKFGLPHGHAVALFLPFFIYYHKTIDAKECLDSRGKEHLVKQMKKIASILGLRYNTIEKEVIIFFKRIGITLSFSKLNISRTEFQTAIKDFSQDRLRNNPGKISRSLVDQVFIFNNNNA